MMMMMVMMEMVMMSSMIATINRCFIFVILLSNLDTVMFKFSKNWVTAILFSFCQIKC
jgi:hypothetical protein